MEELMTIKKNNACGSTTHAFDFDLDFKTTAMKNLQVVKD